MRGSGVLLAILLAAASCAPAPPPHAPSTVELPPQAPGPPPDPERRVLDEHALGNVVAFARLLGYVRYFHPSDGALVADWDAIAVAGMRRVEDLATPERLADAFREILAPVAPTVRVHRTGVAVATPPALLPPPGAPPLAIVGLVHHGIGGGRSRVYRTERVDDRERHAVEPGELVQEVDAAPYRGKRVVVRASVRAELAGRAARTASAAGVEGGALFGVRVVLPGGLTGFVDEMEDRPIVSPRWRDYSVTGEVDEDAERLEIRFALKGEGKAWIDDVSLEVAGGAAGPPLANAGFEQGSPGEVPVGWRSGGPAPRTGYQVESTGDHPRRGARSASIASVALPPHVLAEPAKTFDVDLGAGVSASVPLTLYRDEGGTLPHVPWPRVGKGTRGWFEHPPEERAARLAVVALAWNAAQHFHPYFDVTPVDWPAELRRALAHAAVAPDGRALLGTLHRMMAALQDGHATAQLFERSDDGEARPAADAEHCLPLTWSWVEDRLVVSSRRRGVTTPIRVGDVVTSIGGVPARQALDAAVVSAATPQHARVLALHELRCGPRLEDVELGVAARDGASFAVKVRRDGGGGAGEIDEPRPAKVAEIEPGLHYVDLSRASEADLEDVIPRLAAARGIVFDLRGSPRSPGLTVLRHLTDTPLVSPRWLVPRVTRPDHEAPAFTATQWTAPPLSPRLRARVAFLTDARAVGFAETLLGIVEHHRLGDIVGGPTAGTNGSASTLRLPGGFSVDFTGMKVLKQDGSRHHGVGILPTVPASRTLAGVAAGTDEVLVRALSVVRGS